MGESVPRIFHSTAFRVTPRSASVRTTIPAAIAAILGLEHLSALAWTVEEGTKVVVSVEKPGSGLGGKKSSSRD